MNAIVGRAFSRSYLLSLILTLVSSGWLCVAQEATNKGIISGMVIDASGGVIPGAKVSGTSDATGLRRDTVTNSAGVYELDTLDPGTYSVDVESSGVKVSLRAVPVSIGGNVRVNVSLSTKNSVEVIDLSASSVATTQPSASELLDQNVIGNLPVDGRRFQDLATLAPGVQVLPETRLQLSFSGQRGIYSNVMVEGSDYNEPFLGGVRGGERSGFAFTIPLSAIQEFQVVESQYSNAYGRSTGGLLNVLTRSGSNRYHGEAFYQVRDQALSVNNPYGWNSLDNQHQFGVSLGGPLRRNKLFFFLAGEGQYATFPQTIRFRALDAFAGNVTPAIAPAYNYFRSLEGSVNQTNNIGSAFGRVDYQFNGGSRLALRYNHSQNRAQNAILPGSMPELEINRAASTNVNEFDRTDTATAQLTSILPGLVNDFRASYSREANPQSSNSASAFVQAGVLGSYGTDPNAPSDLADYRTQLSDQVSFVKGRHSVSTGVDYNYISAASRTGANQYGSFVVDSTDPLRILQILSGTVVNRFDDPSVTYLRQVGDLSLGAHAHQAGVFAQDNWRINRTFSLNYGLRWEGQINPRPRTDNSFLLNNVKGYSFPLGNVDPSVIRSQLNQWSPRLSLVWDPNGNSSTVVRVSASRFYGQTPLAWYAGPISNFSASPSDLTLQIAPSGANTVYRQLLAGGFNLNNYTPGTLPVLSVMDVWSRVAGQPNQYAQANVVTTSGNNFRNPHSTQLSLSVQHEFSRRLAVDFQVDHVAAANLERNVDFNTPLPTVQTGDLSLRPFFGLRSGALRPNPNLGAVIVRDSSARSNYWGNTLRTRYRMNNRLQFSAHYTFSYNKSDDDNERQLTAISYQNPYDFRPDYNWSNFDARHVAAGYAIWQGPWGLEATGHFQYQSGLPVDAITGADSSQLLTPNFGSRPLASPGVFMLRNSFRNRDFKTVNLRVAKSIRIQEALSLQLHGDLFNLFNFSNVQFTPSILYPDNPAFIYGPGVLPNGQAVAAGAGFLNPRTASGGWAPGTTFQRGTPFQAQLGARLTF